jgi:hypothetical protein
VDKRIPSFEHGKQCVAKGLHPIVVPPDVMPVFETGGSDVIASLIAAAVRWTMTGQSLPFAPSHESFALLGCQVCARDRLAGSFNPFALTP